MPNVGTLYLHRVTKNSTTAQVTMLELVLSSPVNGLPVCTNIRVATARAGVQLAAQLTPPQRHERAAHCGPLMVSAY